MKKARWLTLTLRCVLLAGMCLLAPLTGGEYDRGEFLVGQQWRSLEPGGRPGVRVNNGPASTSRFRVPTVAVDASLEAKIEEILGLKPYNRADWGIEVLSLDDNLILYAHNSNQPMIPASNVKLFTTAAAMHYLGPEYRFKTAVFARPNLEPDGTLQGDLVLRGGGDPFFSKNFTTDNPLFYFDEIAQQVRSQGVRRIGGNLIGDDSLYSPEALSRSMTALGSSDLQESQQSAGGPEGETDEEAGRGPPAGSFGFSDTMVGVRVVATRNGKPVQVSIEPRTSFFKVVNRALTTTGRRSTLRVTRVKESNTIIVTGRLPVRKKTFFGYIALEEPAAFAAYVLKEALERNGIEVAGEPQSNHGRRIAYGEMRELARHESPPLVETISIINKQSVNSDAELLLRLIGTEIRGQPTPEAGISVVQELVAQTGINPANVSISDGSGLSRSNSLSPHAEIALLRYVASQQYYPHFVSSLAVAGVDGTLRYRLSGEATVQRIFGKTGTLSNVVALGGFMVSLQGKRLAFAIFCNNSPRGTASVRRAVDQIMEVLARHDYLSSDAIGADSNSTQALVSDPFHSVTSCCMPGR